MEDFSVVNLDETTKNILKYLGNRNDSVSTLRCSCCGKIVACKSTNTHFIIEPCVRVVLGIHPKIYSTLYPKPVILISKTVFYGYCCNGDTILNLFTKLIPEIKLNNYPIIDMPFFQEGKGCWITVTEFPKYESGGFLNFQTDYATFEKIVKNFIQTSRQ